MDIRYRDLREDNDYTQKDIATLIGVKDNVYSKWERCINDMPLEKCNELANLYGVTIDYLLGISNNKKDRIISTTIDWKLLSERLLYQRKKHALTQSKLGDKVGFVQTTYGRYEIGVRKPTTFKLLYIAKFYNISVDYLLGRKNDSKIR